MKNVMKERIPDSRFRKKEKKKKKRTHKPRDIPFVYGTFLIPIFDVTVNVYSNGTL
jgi:hypothetical protein